MATDEGVRLLLRGYNGNDIQNQHRETASKISMRLGELALAIDQAAAYIKYKRIPLDRLEEFLTTYEVERQNVLSYNPKIRWEYEHVNAFTTWELSFQQLVSGDEPWKKDAGHFLTLSAFFASTTISESIFRSYQKISLRNPAWTKIFSDAGAVQDEDAEDAKDVNKKVGKDDSQSSEVGCDTWDSNRFWDVIAKADDLSLLQSISPSTGHEGANFSLHPLIRDWLQVRLDLRERLEYTHEAIEALRCCAEEYYSLSTSLSERTALITHMDASLSNDERFSKPQDRIGYRISTCVAARWFAYFYNDFGRYRTSKDLYCRVLETRRNVLGEKHPDTLRSMGSVAGLLYRLGNYEKSERMHRETLALREIELGKEHSDTLRSMNSLGLVLADQGKYGEAESIHRHTLILREKVLGKKHLSTLESMNNLASVLSYQEKDEEAECIFGETLALLRTILGKEDPYTLISMNNLALLLDKRRKWDEAERLYRETLALRETILGKEHPDTLSSMQNLAAMLAHQERFEEAEPIFRETLMLREMILGKDHPDTLWSMNSLAEMLADQERFEEAEPILRETLILREMVLGKDHPKTLRTRDCLASVLRRHKHQEAELIAAVQMTEQSETSKAPCPTDDPASPNPVDGRLSLIGTLRSKHGAQLPETWKTLESDEDDGGDDNEGRKKRRERGRRGAWISSRLAKRAKDAMHRLQSAPKKGQDRRAGTSESTNPIRGADLGLQLQSSSQ